MKSLYSFFGGKENAAKYLPTVFLGKRAESAFQIQTGSKIELNSSNAFSKATMDAANNPKKYEVQGNEGDRDRNYNCHTAAVKGSKGEEFHNSSNMDIDDRNETLKSNYENTTSGEATFGETIITYGDQHSAGIKHDAHRIE